MTEKKLRPRAITAAFFSDRVDGISPAASKAIHQALKDAKLLNATGFLIEDPRWGSSQIASFVFSSACPLLACGMLS